MALIGKRRRRLSAIKASVSGANRAMGNDDNAAYQPGMLSSYHAAAPEQQAAA